MPAAKPQGEVRQRVAINLDACIECRSCAAACLYGHHELPIVHFARVGAAMLPAICRQCLDAPCVAACPWDAMRKDESGAVYRAIFRCRGCGSCVQACPFGVLSTEMHNGEIAKCDLCYDLIDKSDNDYKPRCVASCPTGALHFIEETQAQELRLVVLGSRTVGQHPIRRR
ncbi:MAG: 4Fe-4S dicluster domain-containing protein [Planctomycetota bacterium]|nr:MAG: 4Fe-4S dicluster domain-containing protein [Planctomycetota bacterium]